MNRFGRVERALSRKLPSGLGCAELVAEATNTPKVFEGFVSATWPHPRGRFVFSGPLMWFTTTTARTVAEAALEKGLKFEKFLRVKTGLFERALLSGSDPIVSRDGHLLERWRSTWMLDHGWFDVRLGLIRTALFREGCALWCQWQVRHLGTEGGKRRGS